MKFNSFFKTFLLGFLVVFVASCDKDFNEIGADFVDNDHYTFTSAKYDVKAYNQPLGIVQTSNLPVNALGYYNNPVFGKTTANFVTQLELASINPTIVNSATATVDSVYLHVPYFSHVTGSDSNNESTYELDSIYGAGKIKLDVFRSNYYLRNLDANPISGLLEQQVYFSEQPEIETQTLAQYPDRLNNKGLLPTDLTYQNDNFEFRNTPIKFYKPDGTVRERLLPGVYMDLDEGKFLTDIIRAGSANLADNNVFKNYYRGLYFKVTPHSSAADGASLAMLNFAQGKIVIVYHDETSAAVTTSIRKTMTLNMKGFTVNLLENTNTATSTGYTNAINNNIPDTPEGDSRLYLKGGAGAMSVIDLFRGLRNDDPVDPSDPLYENPLHVMRRENWLINEANLVFNIDNTAAGMGANDISLEPNRILLLDLNNNRPLLDYYTDSSTFLDPKFNKLIHSGIIRKTSATARGTQYKIRITNHIRNLVRYGGANVNQDSTNVKLGLVVTESINSVVNGRIKNPFSYFQTNVVTGLPELKMAKNVPLMSVANPLGTVLYGSSLDVPANLRLQLEIVYTKPD